MHNKSLKEIRHFVILLKRWRRRVIIYSELIERNISCTTIADDALPWQTNAVVVVNSERWHRDGIVECRQCRYVTSKYFLIIYDETNDHKHTCHVCYSHKVPMMYQYRLYGITKGWFFSHSCYCRGRCLKEVIVMKILLSSLILYAQSFHPLVFCYLCKYLLIWLLKSPFLFLIPLRR